MLSKEFESEVDKMDRSALREAYDYMQGHQSRLAVLGTMRFRIGQKVQFEAKGMIHNGTIKKINKTTISVSIGLVIWKVSPHLLTIVG